MGRKVISITEDELRDMITEAVRMELDEGKWANRAAGLALGAASLFGGTQSMQGQTRGLNTYYGNEPTQTMNIMKSKGYENVNLNKQGTHITYTDPTTGKNGIYSLNTSLIPTQQDMIGTRMVNNDLNHKLENASEQGLLDLSEYPSIPSTELYHTSLKDIMRLAFKGGFNKDNFMIFNDINNSGKAYILPKTNNIHQFYAINSINGI